MNAMHRCCADDIVVFVVGFGNFEKNNLKVSYKDVLHKMILFRIEVTRKVGLYSGIKLLLGSLCIETGLCFYMDHTTDEMPCTDVMQMKPLMTTIFVMGFDFFKTTNLTVSYKDVL